MQNMLALLLALSLMFTGLAVGANNPDALPEGVTKAEAPAAETVEEAPAEAPVLAEAPLAPAAEEAAPAEEAPAAETAPVEKVGLPQIGDVVNGFEVQEIRPFDMIGAQVVVFEHQKTGAKFVYIANDDTNRVYELVFKTDTINDKGLPHVFEHATLDGSAKYPPKSLFFNLSYQTYNTYMNATTYPIMTCYPVASLSEAQLLRYADYYTDSCLYPRIMEDESIFTEEAWRYRLENPDDELTIEGTVYSEMLGAYTLERYAAKSAMKDAFPGSLVGNEQGGLPEAIPEMTWEELRNYHDLYYHPSNMTAYLYGDFDDYTAFLALLDEAISPFEKKEFKREDAGYQAITEPVSTSYGFPVEAGSDTDHTSVVYYQIVCPGLEGEEEMVLNTLTDLMVAGSSSMSQAVSKALPTAVFSTYIETSAPDDAIVFIAQKVDPEDAETFRTVIDEELAKIAQNGFGQDFVDGVMANVSMSILLTRESSEVGTGVISSLAYDYSVSGNLFGYMDYVDALGLMDQWNSEGKYAAAASKWLIGSKTTALTVTYPVPGLKEEKDAAERERLAQIKAAMSEEEIAELVARTNAEKEEEDSSQYVAQLQAVTVESLPEEIKLYEVTDETNENGVRHVNATAAVAGIGDVNIFLDAAAVPQEDLHWFKLLTGLIPYLDTENHTREEMAVLSTRYLYGASVRCSLLDQPDGGYHQYLRMVWTGRDEDLAEGYDLMYEQVFGLKLDNVQQVLEGVQALRTGVRSSVQSGPYNVQLYRALSVSNPLWRCYNYMNYLEYYDFLTQVEQALAENPEAVTAKLQSVREFLRNSDGAIAAFAGNKESQAINAPLADAFLARMNREAREPVVYDLPLPAQSEALVIESSVQYNAVVADFESVGLEGYDGGMDAISALVLDKFLYPMLRDQYGAYGVLHGMIEDGGVYIISYRDPNVLQTYQVYAQLPQLVAGLDVDQETLDGYILSSYSGFALSTGELSGASTAMLNYMEGVPQETPLNYMSQLKQITPDKVKAFASVYQALMEKGIVSTAGGMSAINQVLGQVPDMYQSVLNPFGAKDNTQVALEDLTEDNPHYAAVRFMFENGIMAAKSETAFGVDDPATVGEMMAGVYAIFGGAPGAPEEAHAWLAGYGLVPEDLDINTELTEKFACDLLEGAFGGPVITTDTPDQVMTRGDLADVLQMVLQAVSGQ